MIDTYLGTWYFFPFSSNDIKEAVFKVATTIELTT
jgi:hypothetical protein